MDEAKELGEHAPPTHEPVCGICGTRFVLPAPTFRLPQHLDYFGWGCPGSGYGTAVYESDEPTQRSRKEGVRPTTADAALASDGSSDPTSVPPPSVLSRVGQFGSDGSSNGA